MSQGLLLLLVCALPWWFGAIQPFAQFVCSLAVLAAALLTAGAQLLGNNDPHPFPRAMMVTLLAALALGAFQLLPLPNQLLDRLLHKMRHCGVS